MHYNRVINNYHDINSQSAGQNRHARQNNVAINSVQRERYQPQTSDRPTQRHDYGARTKLHQQQQQQQHHQIQQMVVGQQQSQNSTSGHHVQQQQVQPVQQQQQQNQSSAPARFLPPTRQQVIGGSSVRHDMPVRMLVNARYVGALIGQGGANIRLISRDSKARCVIDTARSIRGITGSLVEKAVNVFGTAENCSTACLKILELVSKEAKNDSLNDGRNVEPELKLLANNNFVGRVIGKQGAFIKKVMNDTSCVVFISNHNDMNTFTMERIITIRGASLTQISQAEALLSSKLRSCYEYDLNNSLMALYGPGASQNMAAFAHHHPSASGHPAPPIAFHTPHGVYASLTASTTMAGSSSHHAQSHALSHQGTSQSNIGTLSAALNDMSLGGGGATNATASFQQHISSQQHGQVGKLYVWVPAGSVGALIGTRGSNIRFIVRATGAHLRIESPKPGSSPVTVTEIGGVQKEEMSASSGSLPGQVIANGNIPVNGPNSIECGRRSATPGSKDQKAMANGESASARRRVIITGNEAQQYKCQLWIFQRICEQTLTFFDDVRLMTEIPVSSTIIGRFIGKQGQNVKELQRFTGAHIKVVSESSKTENRLTSSNLDESKITDAEEHKDDALIRITGNFGSCQAVLGRIRMLNRQNVQKTPQSDVNNNVNLVSE